MPKAAKTTKSITLESAKPAESKRRDQRKAVLVYMQTDLIEAAKETASANDEKLWQFVERTVAKALGWKKPRDSKRWIP
ncbi:hypothetical protein [Bradyrhizobium diazoefficiens]|uniref:Uncharacterized protein n=1 Tax=Bradyrhizobium diazoefficiens TaxID=1355477 RepID=A0A810B1U2_9BRAD|nr:hypothetical protein XF8B_03630 [Bradyrhizobium diazoefficiens]